MTAFFFICVLDRYFALFHEYRRRLTQRPLVLALAPGGSARCRRALSSPSSIQILVQRCRAHTSWSSRRSLHTSDNNTKRLPAMASRPEIRRRRSAADGTPVEPSILASALGSAASSASSSSPSPSPSPLTSKLSKHRSLDGSIWSTPPSSKRHSRTGSASRVPNRLSLTLPIALPTSDPTRPTPTTTASTPLSIPPTPRHHPGPPSPCNVDEFIRTIAAKERRVLELREALAHEESELAALKKQFCSVDALRNRDGGLHDPTSREFTPAADGGSQSPRCSVDVDHRRSLLLQTQNQGTPTQNRRTAFRGRHTRTLSLLSPARPKPEFSVLEDKMGPDTPSSSYQHRTTQAANPVLAKRASWQPRSQQSPLAASQFMQDVRLGFKAFVEDIRQITIGDEPILGHSESPLQQHRTGSTSRAGPSDQARCRNGQAVQSRASPLEASAPAATASPTPTSSEKDVSLERSRPAKSKHFSWTPLGFDSLDDTDWASWESPVAPNTTRWSGSTVHDAAMDDIQSISEHEEHATPVKPKNLETPILSPNKLEEIFPNVVNRLSPSNIKRTANNLLDEWEKSLVAPTASEEQQQQANKENTAPTRT
ncbi:uncharacterized protein MAM_00485 [Metarhizium album ARSEF 1941]|uniref:DUF4048 domain-containing protein n=1 Tax=Metarhizium album (strain ARSEF 1941) TaxID=1081103 RepID=A0A0B2X534_METAS|nr:uncharacterized protein MAM_00485 [Metarhizium album ARSEF 1941]KHO01484.1 hypothetical protein MAM_00485 [Metarhizium album ARSEF 1941]